jgi:hypothetical protein
MHARVSAHMAHGFFVAIATNGIDARALGPQCPALTLLCDCGNLRNNFLGTQALHDGHDLDWMIGCSR